jgi:hypothetical protein
MKIKIVNSKNKISKTRYDKIDDIRIFTIKGINKYLVIKEVPLLVSNPIKGIKRQYYLTKRSIKQNYKIFSLWFKEVILRKPIYAFSYSRDCDMRESCGYIKFNNRNEFNDYETNLFDSAEGQTFLNRISEEEYLDNTQECTDDYGNDDEWQLHAESGSC